MTPYVFVVGSRYTFFISQHHNFIENDKIVEGTLLDSSDDGLDPYDYHLEKCGPDCFKRLLDCNRIHSSWPGKECGFMEEIFEDEEEDEEDIEENVNIR